jgi:hypothetical protein
MGLAAKFSASPPVRNSRFFPNYSAPVFRVVIELTAL